MVWTQSLPYQRDSRPLLPGKIESIQRGKIPRGYELLIVNKGMNPINNGSLRGTVQ